MQPTRSRPFGYQLLSVQGCKASTSRLYSGPDDYASSVIEGDLEVVEDAEADDMLVAEGYNKSGRGLKSTYLNGTSIYHGLNLPAIGKRPALIRVSRLSFNKIRRDCNASVKPSIH